MGQHTSGTLTFLFTDVEESTRRWQQDESAMSESLAAHDVAIRSAVEARGGAVFKHTGDGLCAVFSSASAAIAAALDAQERLLLPVRMGIHTGDAELRDGDYFGPALNRTARVMDAGHGGQVLVSSATVALAQGQDYVDLGTYSLKGLDGVDRLFQVGRGEFPDLRAPKQVPGNLPSELTALVGRVVEVSRLVGELADHRLVTLIGVGGIGKTRLAVETCRVAAASFPDGCWMVQLAPVAVDSAVAFAFAAGVGVTTPAGRDVVDDLVAKLRFKRSLIIVDNCEHVLAAAADVVERILAECGSVSMLVTSREPLMVSGERLLPVPSLPADDAERLFVERAQAEAPDLVIGTDQSRAIAELCRRLDGLPLAIELAASRVRTFTPVELVVNLEERFRLLVGGRRSRMERHQTMRGTLDWSYNLCNDLNKAVFDRLSVFPAGFDLVAARAVAATDGVTDLDVVDAVPQLVDRSLLQRSTAADGTTRFRMLETMRAYGREHLQQTQASDTIRARHAHHIADSISSLAMRTVGPDEKAVSRRLNEYLADALVALDWCIDHHRWEEATRIVFVDVYDAERQTNELFARLHDAVLLADEADDLRDELMRSDESARTDESVAQCVERGLRGIRAKTPVPTDRVSWPPQVDFNDGGFTVAEGDELVASLSGLTGAPIFVRYIAAWATIRGLTHAGHVRLAENLLEPFELLVRGMHSERASRGLEEVHATVARGRGDWVEAAIRYDRIAAAIADEPMSWFALSVTWHRLGAHALAPGPFDFVGTDLTEPWRWFREEHLNVLRFHGASATAVALKRLGHDDLADRFAAWVHNNDEPLSPDMFDDVLGPAGLPSRPVPHADPLDTLIDELQTIASPQDPRPS